MTEIKKPMLADPVKTIDDVRFPVLASAKLDGIRCLKIDGQALYRSFKPIGNNFVRTYLEKHCPNGLDGELMVRNAQFCDLTGAIRREDGEPDFFYAVFDYVTEGIDEPYEDRYENLVDKVKSLNDPRIVLVPHVKVNNLNELKEYERICLDHRFEGVMVRSVDGPYKCGRSSVKEGYLLKIKRVVDSEAEIIDLLPMMHNDNEPDVDMFGRTKRSHCQDGMVEMDTLGKFVVKDDKNFPGATFEIGTGQGLTLELRKKIWMNRNEFKGRFVKYKYQDCGTKDLPRFPVWLGFRDGRDK